MNTLLNGFLQDEQGQDLIEYTLLMAFVALASAAIFIGAGGSISSIWTRTNTQLSAAASSALPSEFGRTKRRGKSSGAIKRRPTAHGSTAQGQVAAARVPWRAGSR